MSREIKFRAWDKRTSAITDTPVVFDGECLGEFSMVNLNMALANNGDADGGGTYIFEQYTGLKDKNGVEIYEGDIVKDESERVGQVVYKVSEFRVRFGDRIVSEVILGAMMNVNTVEVIGNIHENPELLEGEK